MSEYPVLINVDDDDDLIRNEKIDEWYEEFALPSLLPTLEAIKEQFEQYQQHKAD